MPISVHISDERAVPIYLHSVNSSRLISDKFGKIHFPITVSRNSIEQIYIVVRTIDPKRTREEQSESTHIMYAYSSDAGYIAINNKDARITTLNIGETYQSRLTVRSVLLQQLAYIIVSRGQIIKSAKVVDETIEVDITKDLLPTARVIVLGLTRDGYMLSDSVLIKVLQGDCGLDLHVKEGEHSLKPGSTAHIIINGTQGDNVGLLGIDEAVYVLRDKDRLTKPKVFKTVKEEDPGCGPGGGRNPVDVIYNSGLAVLGFELDTPEIIDSACIRTVRVKRETAEVIRSYEGKERKCCILGMMPSKRKRSCQQKARILKEHVPNDEAGYKLK